MLNSCLPALCLVPTLQVSSKKLCWLIILILSLFSVWRCLLYDVCLLCVECLYPVQDWHAGWCHFFSQGLQTKLFTFWACTYITAGWCHLHTSIYILYIRRWFWFSILIQNDITSIHNAKANFVDVIGVEIFKLGRRLTSWIWDPHEQSVVGRWWSLNGAHERETLSKKRN